MTINGFSEFLKKRAEEAFFEASIKDFTGFRLGIDAETVFRAKMHIAYKMYYNSVNLMTDLFDIDKVNDIFLEEMLKEIIKYLEYGVTPVFCLDGKHSKMKDKAKEKRNKPIKKYQERLMKVKDEIALYDIFSVPKDLLIELKDLLIKTSHFSDTQRILFIEMCVGLGIPCVQSIDEAERLCSMLCRYGVVAGVVSTDRDCLPYGAPLMIYDSRRETGEDGYPDIKFDVIILENVLDCLDLEMSELRMLCICSGCDYNKNPYRKGIAWMYKRIHDMGINDIENMGLTDKEIDELEYEFCEKQFKKINYRHIISEEYICYRNVYGFDIQFKEIDDERSCVGSEKERDVDEQDDNESEARSEKERQSKMDLRGLSLEDLEEETDELIQRTEKNKFDVLNNLSINGYATLKDHKLTKYYQDLVMYYNQLTVSDGFPEHLEINPI